MEMLILEMLPSSTLHLAMGSRMFNAESKGPSFQEDRSKESPLLEPSLENQEYFFLMKLLQLWTKTLKRKFKKRSITP